MKISLLLISAFFIASCTSQDIVTYHKSNASPEELGESIVASLIKGRESDFNSLLCSPAKYKDIIYNHRNFTDQRKEKFWNNMYGSLMESENIENLDSINDLRFGNNFEEIIKEGKENGIHDWSKVKFLRTTYSWNDSNSEFHSDSDVFSFTIHIQDKNFLYFISCGSLIFDENKQLLVKNRIEISEPKIFFEALNY